MAQKSQSRSNSLRKATRAALVISVFMAHSAKAEDGKSKPATYIIDRSQWASSVSLERPSATSGRKGISLVLAVSVNGMDHGLAQFRLIDERLWASPKVLRDLGLRAEGSDLSLISLDRALSGEISYNAAMQSVSLMVETGKLAVGTSVLNTINQDSPAASNATGGLLNYDIYANYSGGNFSMDGFAEARLFSGNALLESTAIFRAGSAGGHWRGQAIRLDSSAALSFPQSRLTIRAGDIITRATGWSRPTRIGGLRFGTDFALQPYLVTAPIASFFGEATLPSTLDLYINGLKTYSGQIAPGPFEIGSGTNRINGAGDAHIVVTDILGQITTLDFPIYDAPALLREGLSDWSLEIGAVRENYGIGSFDYASALVASGSWRRGLSNNLTLEAHGEMGASLWNGGAGIAWKMPMGGVLSTSLAISRSESAGHRTKTGHRAEIGYSWADRNFNLSASVQRTDKHYADIASRHGAPVAIERDLVNIGVNGGRYGNFGLSMVRQRYSGDPARSFASLSWNRPLSDRFSVSASLHQDLGAKPDRSGFLTVTFVPGNRQHLSANVRAAKARTNLALSYRRSLPYAGGTGWAVTSNYDGQHVQAAVQVDHLGSFGQITAGTRLNKGRASAYAGYSGALVVMGDDLFLSRKIYDGFAVVSASGIADVPVKLHNREIGRTDGNGHLLVTGLNAYQANKLSVDPTDLPANMSIASIDQQAVPSQRSGVLINFEIVPTRSVLMTLVDGSGAIIPLGVQAQMTGSDGPLFMVGFDGQLFIEEAIAGAAVSVMTPAGPCAFRLPDDLPAHKAGRLGTMICEAV